MRGMKRLAIVALVAIVSACHREGSPASSTFTEPTQTAAAQAPGLLAVGQPVPKIDEIAHDGTRVDFSALRGQVFVVYFYPKDDSPG